MNLKVILKISLFVLTMLFILLGCTSYKNGESHGHVGINKVLQEKSLDTINYKVSTTEALRDLQKIMVNLPEQELKFHIPKRSSEINSFPCSNCHTQSLSELQKNTSSESQKAHWDIKLKHAGQDVMDCNTCHNTNNLDQLVTLTGQALDIDHSYQQCGQCHSQQKKDWIGGAHGKRIGGWAPPRVVNTCVNCHNPHDPAFKTRWPARLNTVKLRQQSQ